MRAPGIPVVGIPCDIFDKGLHPFHGVGEKYINAVAHGARALPLLIPGLGRGRDLEPIGSLLDMAGLLDSLDGIFLTGSPSNVEPARFVGGERREVKAMAVSRARREPPTTRNATRPRCR